MLPTEDEQADNLADDLGQIGWPSTPKAILQILQISEQLFPANLTRRLSVYQI